MNNIHPDFDIFKTDILNHFRVNNKEQYDRIIKLSKLHPEPYRVIVPIYRINKKINYPELLLKYKDLLNIK